MRLWSLDPGYLDARGLVALWREALLAQKVLKGGTKGYRHHPQLIRFRESPRPVAAIATYLLFVHGEAARRGYNFDKSKIEKQRMRSRLPVSRKQLEYEFRHLKKKLAGRDTAALKRVRSVSRPRPHALFRVTPGPVAAWEVRTGKRIPGHDR